MNGTAGTGKGLLIHTASFAMQAALGIYSNRSFACDDDFDDFDSDCGSAPANGGAAAAPEGSTGCSDVFPTENRRNAPPGKEDGNV